MLAENRMRCFLSLAETLNFTKTGKELFMTQQAVSRLISQLEADVGLRLFERSTRSVSLTAEGRELCAVFKDFFERYDTFIAENKARPQGARPSIRIGCQHKLDYGNKPGLIRKQLMTEYPNLDVVFEMHPPNQLQGRLEAGILDAVLILSRLAPWAHEYKSKVLFLSPIHLLVSESHPLVREGATYKDFIHEPIIINSYPEESAAETIARTKKEANALGLYPSEIMTAPNRDSAYVTAATSRGVLISSARTHIGFGNSLRRYPTDSTEEMLCVWKTESEPLLRYISLLEEAYRQEEAAAKK